MADKKVIWIVNYYTSPPTKAANPRYLKFAYYFMAAGYKVITFNHSFEVEEAFQRVQYGEFDFVHVKSPFYKGNGIKRMYSIWKFAQSLYTHYNKFEKPDFILQNIHPPFDYPVVRMAKKIGAKYIAEAWDLWPENFVSLGLIKRNNPLFKLAHQIEKRYYYAADEIVFTAKGAFDYLQRTGWTKDKGGKIDMNHVHYINNGVDIEQFDKDVITYPRKDEDMNDTSIYKIIYLGSINYANNVQTLIEAAKLLIGYPKYRFFIYGNGVHREKLELMVKEQNISNVVFKEKHISLNECAWVVSQSTVNIMNYKKGFGIRGVSSGKMFLYLAAGKPIVCNVPIKYDDIITNNNLGVAKAINTPEEFASEIKRLAEQPKEEYDAMCSRVRKVAERFDYKILAEQELTLLK